MNNRIFHFAVLAAVAVSFLTARAQDAKDTRKTIVPAAPSAPAVETPTQFEAPVRKQIEDFFATLEKGDVDAAYNQLVQGTKIAERSEEVGTLKTKTRQAVHLFGDFQGHELVELKKVGTHLLAATYMSLGKNFPLRWRFYFYNAGDAWRLIDIRVDDRLADMFGEPTPAEERTGNWPLQQ